MTYFEFFYVGTSQRCYFIAESMTASFLLDHNWWQTLSMLPAFQSLIRTSLDYLILLNFWSAVHRLRLRERHPFNDHVSTAWSLNSINRGCVLLQTLLFIRKINGEAWVGTLDLEFWFEYFCCRTIRRKKTRELRPGSEKLLEQCTMNFDSTGWAKLFIIPVSIHGHSQASAQWIYFEKFCAIFKVSIDIIEEDNLQINWISTVHFVSRNEKNWKI